MDSLAKDWQGQEYPPLNDLGQTVEADLVIVQSPSLALIVRSVVAHRSWWDTWTRLPSEEPVSVGVKWFALPGGEASFDLSVGTLERAANSPQPW